MKRPCRNASQTSIIKMRELHPIPLKTFNFNWMKSKNECNLKSELMNPLTYIPITSPSSTNFRSRLMYSDCEFAPACPLGRNSQ